MADRFPFPDLATAAGGAPVRVLAAQLGVPARTVHRWQRAGVVPPKSADRAAVALGHHPAEIWPTWATDAPWSSDDV